MIKSRKNMMFGKQKKIDIQEEEVVEKEDKPIIVFENVSMLYKENEPVLKNINISIQEGEFVSLVGPSGAGKSTLMRLLYAEEFPTEGMVYFGGRPTTAVKRKLLPYYRRNFGLVFQDFKLLPNKTVFENVAFALEVAGWTTKNINREIPGILAVVGLEKKSDMYPYQLSGGESQRVSLARALVHRPHVLVADEPTGNLDPKATRDIMDLLLKMNEFGATVLLATHAKDIVDDLGRRVIALENGHVVRDEANGKYFL